MTDQNADYVACRGVAAGILNRWALAPTFCGGCHQPVKQLPAGQWVHENEVADAVREFHAPTCSTPGCRLCSALARIDGEADA